MICADRRVYATGVQMGETLSPKLKSSRRRRCSPCEAPDPRCARTVRNPFALPSGLFPGL